MSAATLLIEIGCEELPASFCESALRQLAGEGGETGLAERLLSEARLLPEDFGRAELRVLVSPRRVAVVARRVPSRQRGQTLRYRGPRVAVAFGPDGAPTKAGEGFARGRGVEVAALGRETVDDTEFVVAEVEAAREETLAVLPALVARLIEDIQVPRGMRWGRLPPGADDYLRFSRPVRWVVAKHGAATARGRFYDLELGATTFGHRVLGGPAVVDEAERYERVLAEQCVIVDQDERRRLVVAGLDAAAHEAGGEWSDPGDVLAEAVYLAEWPSVARGSFDARHLRLPREVLVTAMQSHQRYFPVRGGDGDLLPVFLYVSNAEPDAAEAVTRGNQRVLDGRLDDAEFAYDRDIAEGLPAMAARLDKVVFHEKLGSLADKARRLSGLVEGLASGGLARGRPSTVSAASEGGGRGDEEGPLVTVTRRAAELAKADLVSQVVIEFPDLQGRMGEVYARACDEPDAVARAIGEQYLPLSATAPVPASLAGGLLAVAEKADNIVGAWVAGAKPSGSRDPYGLRRAAMGIVRIALRYSLRVPVRVLLRSALYQYEAQAVVEAGRDRGDEIVAEAEAFVLERLEALLLDEGLPFVAVEAALGAEADDVPALAARARTFAAMSGREMLEDVAVAYDRCASLAGKAGAGSAAGSPDPALFGEEAERLLAATLAEVAPEVDDALENLEIESALVAAARLRTVVDRYFDDVLVMDPDEQIRGNRLAQLAAVTGLLGRIGEFGRLPAQDEGR